MQPTSFIAASAEEAVTQIRARLGPEAVVLNVRPLPANGLARFWQRPMIEVLACKPEAPVSEPAPILEALAEFRQQLYEIKQQVESQASRAEREPLISDSEDLTRISAEVSDLTGSHSRAGVVLNKAGLLPLHVQHVLDQLHAEHGDVSSVSLGEEIALTLGRAGQVLAQVPSDCPQFGACPHWARRLRQDHLFVQMAYSGRLGGWAVGASVAPGWGHGEYGGIAERLL